MNAVLFLVKLTTIFWIIDMVTACSSTEFYVSCGLCVVLERLLVVTLEQLDFEIADRLLCVHSIC